MQLEQREENLRFTEGFRQKMRQVIREENDEDREIEEHYLRLEYMHENCMENDRDIQGLLEEQRELLNILRMKKGEFADNWQKKVHIY